MKEWGIASPNKARPDCWGNIGSLSVHSSYVNQSKNYPTYQTCFFHGVSGVSPTQEGAIADFSLWLHIGLCWPLGVGLDSVELDSMAGLLSLVVGKPLGRIYKS